MIRLEEGRISRHMNCAIKHVLLVEGKIMYLPRAAVFVIFRISVDVTCKLRPR
jgi:hypothetical protein